MSSGTSDSPATVGETSVCALPGAWRSLVLTSRVTGAGQRQLLCVFPEDQRHRRATASECREANVRSSVVNLREKAVSTSKRMACLQTGTPSVRTGVPLEPACWLTVSWNPQFSCVGSAVGVRVRWQGLSTSAGPVPPWPRLHSPSWLYCVSAAVHFFALSSPHHGISWGLEVREVTSGGRRSVPADSSPRPGRWGDAHPRPRARAQAREGEDVCWGHSQWSVALAVSAGLYHCRLSSACSKGFDIVTPVGWFRIFQHRCVESSVWTLSAFLSQVRKCGMALETQANLVLSRVCR